MNSPPRQDPTSPAVMAARSTLTLSIISLTGPHWQGDVREVSLPGSDGRFGVMARHVPMLSTLEEGMISIHPAGDEPPLHLYVSGGFVEVQPDQVTVLADLAVRSEDQDQARAHAAREAATSPMATSFTDQDYSSMHLELMHHFGGTLLARPWK